MQSSLENLVKTSSPQKFESLKNLPEIKIKDNY